MDADLRSEQFGLHGDSLYLGDVLQVVAQVATAEGHELALAGLELALAGVAGFQVVFGQVVADVLIFRVGVVRSKVIMTRNMKKSAGSTFMNTWAPTGQPPLWAVIFLFGASGRRLLFFYSPSFAPSLSKRL